MVTIRKLVKAGQASHTVSLPKDWLEKNNLKAGDPIYIHEKNDNRLTISTKHHEETLPEKETTLTLDGKDTQTIQRELTAAYLNSYRSIHMISNKIQEHLPTIRPMLQSFVALEIAEQTPKSVIIKDFLDMDGIILENTLKRMDMMVRTMLGESTESEIPEDLRTKDEEVNKLYFLLSRHLKSALITPSLSEKLGINHDQILNQWYLVLNLENLADCVKNIHMLLEKPTSEKTKLMKELLKTTKVDYEIVMKAFYQKDKGAAETIIKNRTTRVEQCNDLLRKHNEVQIGEFAERCKAMSTIITNIGKIVIDAY